MMKKLSVLAVALVLAACGSSSDPEKTATAKSTADDKGDFATVEVTVQGDKVTKISIDETKEGKSKKELGADYGMKSTSAKSGIGKEWNEQVEFLENYIVKNGLSKVELSDAGTAKNDDVLSGCTINIKNIVTTANQAVEDAKASK